MTASPSSLPIRRLIVCVDDEAEWLDRLASDVRAFCAGQAEVAAYLGGDEVLAALKGLDPSSESVVAMLVDHRMPGLSGVEVLLGAQALPQTKPARKVLLSARTAPEDTARLLKAGAVHRTLPKPWTADELHACLRGMLTDFCLRFAPDAVQELSSLLDVERLSEAYVETWQAATESDSRLHAVQRSFLADLHLSDEEVEDAVVESVDRVLQRPPRREYAKGNVLFEEDDHVGEIFILLEGSVQLSRRSDGRDVVFHAHSAGRIIGLLSLAQGRRAFFTCKALTDLSVIPLSMEQLDQAMECDPILSVHFVTALVRSLARRIKRSAELKVEVENLNGRLRSERDQLAEAFHRLEEAQMQLVASGKLATLGELTAGIAHELNNPVTAIRRSADFLAEDIAKLMERVPDGPECTAAMEHALMSAPMSTREVREKGRALFAVVGDDPLTRRLVKIGVADAESFKHSFAGLDVRARDERLATMERYHALGEALRNIRSCGDRIAALVGSLRSYARTSDQPQDGVDVHEGLEDTLRLFGHALREVHVKRSYGELRPIEGHPGELNQVWTNLIANALHAIMHAGEIRIETDQPDAEHVRVRIIDTGEGIPAEKLDSIFEMHFTTKGGRVEFGLGLGLPISRQIIARHGGTITVDSQPGQTCFTVILPIRFPRDLVEGAAS